MSYYELVKHIKLLKEAPMDDTLIKKIDDDKTKYHQYVLTRLILHIYSTIDERLNRAGYLCLKSIASNKRDTNSIELDFINLKKEKVYALKLANLKIFDTETKQKMKNKIIRKYVEIYDFLKQEITKIDNDGIYLNILEKILQSSVEE